MRRFAILELGLLVVFIALLAWAPRQLRLAPPPHDPCQDDDFQAACFQAAIIRARHPDDEVFFLSARGEDPSDRVLQALGAWRVRPVSSMHAGLSGTGPAPGVGGLQVSGRRALLRPVGGPQSHPLGGAAHHRAGLAAQPRRQLLTAPGKADRQTTRSWCSRT